MLLGAYEQGAIGSSFAPALRSRPTCSRRRPLAIESGGAAAGASAVRSPAQEELSIAGSYIRRASTGQPLYRAEDDTYLLPLVTPEADKVPFACALELTAKASGQTSGGATRYGARHPGIDHAHSSYTLRYVLDGALKDPLTGRDSLETGDSMLRAPTRSQEEAAGPADLTSPLSVGADLDSAGGDVLQLTTGDRCGQNSPARASDDLFSDNATAALIDLHSKEVALRPRTWQAASLLFLLPPDHAAMQPDILMVSQSWRQGAVSYSLAASELSSIFAGAQRCADTTFAQPQSAAPVAHDTAPSHPRQPTTQARISPPVLQHLAQLPEALIRSLMLGSFRSRQPQLGPQRHAAESAVQAKSHGQKLGPGGRLRRAMRELIAMRLPNQSNRLALVFDPINDAVPFTFGIEIFEAGHKTSPHSHSVAHELFFILAGEGEGFCNHERFPLAAGDLVVFAPQSVHGIDNGLHGRMYCLELMLPNDMFAEFVKAGTPTGSLRDEDLCILIAAGCGNA